MKRPCDDDDDDTVLPAMKRVKYNELSNTPHPPSKTSLGELMDLASTETIECEDLPFVIPHSEDDLRLLKGFFVQFGWLNLKVVEELIPFLDTTNTTLLEDLWKLEMIQERNANSMRQSSFRRSLVSKLIPRVFIQVKETPKPTFKVMQYNILADSLSGWKNTGQEGFEDTNTEVLLWEFRGNMIIREISQEDPSIICMQEVDKHGWLASKLMEYDTRHKSRPKGTICDRLGDNPDGCSVFWKRDTWDFKEEFSNMYEFVGETSKGPEESSQVFLCVLLVHKQTGKEVLIVTTHLKATKTLLGEKYRLGQVEELKRQVVGHFGARTPLIVGADMNASSKHTDVTFRGATHKFDPLAYQALLSSDFGLESGYKCLLGNEPEYTTAKVRKSLYADTVDYIAFNPQAFEPTGYLSIPVLKSLEETGYFPSANYPSDHLSILVEFAFTHPAQRA